MSHKALATKAGIKSTFRSMETLNLSHESLEILSKNKKLSCLICKLLCWYLPEIPSLLIDGTSANELLGENVSRYVVGLRKMVCISYHLSSAPM